MHKILKISSNFAGLLIFLFPLFFLVIDHWGSTISTLFALTIVFYAFVPNGREFTNYEKQLCVVICLFVFSVLATYFLVDSGDFNLSRVKRYCRIFLVIPILIVLLRAKPNIAYLWYGVAFGAIFNGVFGLVEWFGQPHKPYRIQGDTNPIVFGDISLAMACLCLASWQYFKNKNIWNQSLPALGGLLSLSACMLSGTRTAWLAGLVVGLAYYFWIARKRLSSVRSIVVIVLCAVLFSIFYATPQTGLQLQIGTVFADVKKYTSEENISTSIGARLEMWGTAAEIFTEHPVLGAGAGEFKKRMLQGIEDGKYEAVYQGFSEPHNAYVDALSSRGLLGIMTLLLLLFIPFRAFGQVIRKQAALSPVALAGLMFMIAYAVMGVSASVFEMPRILSFFGFYLAVLMSYSSDLSRDALAK